MKCLFQLTLLPVLCVLSLANQLSATPIQMQATAVGASLRICETFSIQAVAEGVPFSFGSKNTGSCGGSGIYGIAGQTVLNEVSVEAFGYNGGQLPMGIGQTVIDYLNIPDNPDRRYASVMGSVFGSGDPITIPATPRGSPLAGNDVHLVGTLSVCLLPIGATGGPCDPNYVDFGIINIDVLGKNLVSLVGGSYDDPSGFNYYFSYSGTAQASAAVPEPGSFSYLWLAGLVVTAVHLIQRARPQE